MTTFKALLSSVLLASLTANAGCGEVMKSDPPQATPDAAEPAKLQVATIPKLPILQGTSAEIEVTVTRLEGVTGAVEIAPVGLPDGVTADPLTIAADATTGTLKLYAAATAPHSLPTQVAVRGTVAGAAAMTDLTVTVYGAPGTLDTSFGGGSIMLPGGAGDDYGSAVVVQPDGKIVIAGRVGENQGDFALVRIDRDGTLDTSFGDGGRVFTDFGGSDAINAIALQPDGKIVAGGVTTTTATSLDFAVARYLPNGQLDRDFGDEGKVMTVLGNDADSAYALVIQSDGKIVLGGDSNRGSSTTGKDFALVRYLPNGSLDTDWSEDGIAMATIADGSRNDTVYALALQTINGQERIVAAGGDGDFMLCRFLPDGTVDNTFNFDSGTIQWIFGGVIGAARALAITPDNRIAVAGHSHEDTAVVMLTEHGYLDESFSGDGKLLTQISTSDDEAQAIAIEADGKLVVAGWAAEPGSSSGNFALTRYNADGTLDTTFGGTGIVVTRVAAGTKPDKAMAIAMQRDERVPTLRIVTAGFASASNSDFAVTRYWR